MHKTREQYLLPSLEHEGMINSGLKVQAPPVSLVSSCFKFTVAGAIWFALPQSVAEGILQPGAGRSDTAFSL